MPDGTVPGTGFRTRSPLSNARDVSRKWDGTSISPKTLTDLKSTAIAKLVGPVADATLDLPDAGPIVGVTHVLAYTTTTGALLALPIEGTDFEVIPLGTTGNGQLKELASVDRSAQTWLIHYEPDAPDIDVPQNASSTVFNPLPLA